MKSRARRWPNCARVVLPDWDWPVGTPVCRLDPAHNDAREQFMTGQRAMCEGCRATLRYALVQYVSNALYSMNRLLTLTSLALVLLLAPHVATAVRGAESVTSGNGSNESNEGNAAGGKQVDGKRGNGTAVQEQEAAVGGTGGLGAVDGAGAAPSTGTHVQQQEAALHVLRAIQGLLDVAIGNLGAAGQGPSSGASAGEGPGREGGEASKGEEAEGAGQPAKAGGNGGTSAGGSGGVHGATTISTVNVNMPITINLGGSASAAAAAAAPLFRSADTSPSGAAVGDTRPDQVTEQAGQQSQRPTNGLLAGLAALLAPLRSSAAAAAAASGTQGAAPSADAAAAAAAAVAAATAAAGRPWRPSSIWSVLRGSRLGAPAFRLLGGGGGGGRGGGDGLAGAGRWRQQVPYAASDGAGVGQSATGAAAAPTPLMDLFLSAASVATNRAAAAAATAAAGTAAAGAAPGAQGAGGSGSGGAGGAIPTPRMDGSFLVSLLSGLVDGKVCRGQGRGGAVRGYHGRQSGGGSVWALPGQQGVPGKGLVDGEEAETFSQ